MESREGGYLLQPCGCYLSQQDSCLKALAEVLHSPKQTWNLTSLQRGTYMWFNDGLGEGKFPLPLNLSREPQAIPILLLANAVMLNLERVTF